MWDWVLSVYSLCTEHCEYRIGARFSTISYIIPSTQNVYHRHWLCLGHCSGCRICRVLKANTLLSRRWHFNKIKLKKPDNELISVFLWSRTPLVQGAKQKIIFSKRVHFCLAPTRDLAQIASSVCVFLTCQATPQCDFCSGSWKPSSMPFFVLLSICTGSWEIWQFLTVTNSNTSLQM